MSGYYPAIELVIARIEACLDNGCDSLICKMRLKELRKQQEAASDKP